MASLPLASQLHSAEPAPDWSAAELNQAFGSRSSEILVFHRRNTAPPRLPSDPLVNGFKPDFYGPEGMDLHFCPPARPLRVAVLTSIRDVGKIERVGLHVKLPSGPAEMKGTLAATLEAINKGVLGPYADVVAIITDDLPGDLEGSKYPTTPRPGSTWIHPIDARNGAGELARDITVNIPSRFRKLRLSDRAGRAELKLEFESQVVEVMNRTGADVLLSDHYLGRIDYLIDPEYFGLFGRVLNTHPGITRAGHPLACRGALPYTMAINHARELAEQGHSATAGASFHLISQNIDEGPVLCDYDRTPIYPDDTIRTVAHRIYTSAKNNVLLCGLRHYASHIFPLLGKVDLNSLGALQFREA